MRLGLHNIRRIFSRLSSSQEKFCGKPKSAERAFQKATLFSEKLTQKKKPQAYGKLAAFVLAALGVNFRYIAAKTSV